MYEILFKYVDTITIAYVADMSVKMIAVITPLMASLVVVYAPCVRLVVTVKN